jgi:hypothetical protein
MIARWLAALDDRINPIVVKELRQAVKSRIVVVVLLLFLVLQLLIVGGTLLTNTQSYRANEDFNLQLGRNLFMSLQATLLTVLTLFIPVYVGVGFGAERTDQSADLLYTTTLRPGAIISGKTVAGLAVGLLVFSTFAPFLTFTYLLRGIDIPTIIEVLVIDLLAAGLALQGAIFFAALPGTRVLKMLFGAGCLFLILVLLFIPSMRWTTDIVRDGEGPDWSNPNHVAGVTVALVSAIAGIGQFYFWAVALISPAPTNYMLPTRVYLLMVWILGLVLAMVISWWQTTPIPVFIWSMLACWIMGIHALITVSEPSTYSTRVRRTIPRSWWQRVLVWGFYTGAGSGLLYCLMLSLTALLIAGLWNNLLTWSVGSYMDDLRHQQAYFDIMLLGIGYVSAYIFSAVCLRYCVRGEILQRVPTWVVVVILVVVGTFVPLGIELINSGGKLNRWEFEWWMTTNLFVTLYLAVEENKPLYDRPHLLICAILVAIWNVVVASLCIPWFLEQWQRFKPPKQAASCPPCRCAALGLY